MVLGLRDRAIKVIQRRERLLTEWSATEKQRVKDWFGVADEETRAFLRTGLAKLIAALAVMTGKNFVRYTPDFGEQQGCIPSSPEDQVAAVCRTDVQTRTIAFTRRFCGISEISPNKDSKISILIHEVTHFDDIFGTYDHKYGLHVSRMLATTDAVKTKTNADSYAGYICDGMIFPD